LATAKLFFDSRIRLNELQRISNNNVQTILIIGKLDQLLIEKGNKQLNLFM